jgi:hypothetical protein
MKTYEGVEVWIRVFLTSALDGGEGPASLPWHFTPGERPPSTHCIRSWVGLRAGLEAMKYEKWPGHAENRMPVVQPIVRQYTDRAMPAIKVVYIFTTAL